MHVVKKLLLGLCVALFGPVIVLLAAAFAFNRTVGQPEFVKRTFREAKIYATLSDLAGNQVNDGADAAKNSLVQEALKDTITPEVIQTAFEQVIDSVYSWMDQGSGKLEFTIDLRPIKQGFIDNLRKKLVAQTNSLPACSYGNLPSSTDIFALTCIPPGTNINAEIDRALNEVLNSGEFLPNDEITADTINKDLQNSSSPTTTSSEGQQETPNNNSPSGVDQQSLDQLAAVYRLIKKSVPYLAVSSAILAIAIVFLSKTWLRGIRKISVLLLANGLLLVVLAIITQALARNLAPSTPSTVENINGSAELAARIIVDAYSLLTRNFGIAFAAAGLVGVIASSVAIAKLEPKSPKAEEVHKQLKDEHLPQTKAADAPEDK